MNKPICTTRSTTLAAMLCTVLFALPPSTVAAACGSRRGAQAQAESPAASEAAARLNKKQFHDVKVSRGKRHRHPHRNRGPLRVQGRRREDASTRPRASPRCAT